MVIKLAEKNYFIVTKQKLSIPYYSYMHDTINDLFFTQSHASNKFSLINGMLA